MPKNNPSKAELHASQLADEMSALLPQLEESYAAYAAIWAQFERRKRVAATYVKRGTMKPEAVPVWKPRQLKEFLRDLRGKKQ